MKLAEALAERADGQRRIAQLEERLAAVARVQEGEEPDEDPAELLRELEELLDRVELLVTRINATNSATPFGDGRTVTEALAARDAAAVRRGIYSRLADRAGTRQDRFSRSEVRFVPSVSVREVRRLADRAARDHRELDTRLQELNWLTDLL